MAVLRLPIWNFPVGEGANLVVITNSSLLN